MKYLHIYDGVNKEILSQGKIVVPEKHYKHVLMDNQYNENNIELLSFAVDYDKVYSSIWKMRNHLLDEMRASLNHAHGLELSKRQYELLFGTLLDHVLRLIYRKIITIKSLNESVYISDCEFKIDLENYFTIDVMDLLSSDSFNSYLYYKVCDCQSIDKKRVLEDQCVYVGQEISKRRDRGWIYYKRFVLGKILNCQFERKKKYQSIIVRSFLPDVMMKEIERRSASKILNFREYFWTSCDYRLQWRIKKKDEYLRNNLFTRSTDKIENLIKNVMAEVLPISLIENLRLWHNSACKLDKKIQCRKIYTAAWAHYSDIFLMFCALKEQQGCDIIELQHSAMYGCNKLVAKTELSIYKKFFTWGWKSNGDNVFKGASLRFAGKKQEVALNDKVEKLLLVTFEDDRHDSLCGIYSEDYEKRLSSFIDRLSSTLKAKLVVRIRNKESYLVKMFEKNYPEIELEFASDIAFRDSICLSDIVVCDHISSPYFESILRGKITYLFNGMKYPQYTDNIIKYFGKLETLDIFRDTGEELANLLNQSVSIDDENHIYAINNIYWDILKEFFNIEVDPVEFWYNEFSE